MNKKNKVLEYLGKRSSNASPILILIGVYIVTVIVFSFLSPYFLSVSNFMKIGLYSSIMGIVAAGVTFTILSGGIDISVGAMVALVGCVSALLLKANWGVFPVVLIGLLVGAVLGLFNGLVIAKIKVNALIVTLGTLTIYRGLALLLTDGRSLILSNKSFYKRISH